MFVLPWKRRVYMALLLGDLHGVLHLRQRLHAAVVAPPLLTVELLLVGFLQNETQPVIGWFLVTQFNRLQTQTEALMSRSSW